MSLKFPLEVLRFLRFYFPLEAPLSVPVTDENKKLMKRARLIELIRRTFGKRTEK